MDNKLREYERQLKEVNKRRFELINASISRDLTDAEEQELESLQARVDKIMDVLAPLPDPELFHG